MQHQQSRDYPNSFTLIEVLVVIAILGILMGLILPTLGPVKERARRLECLSNERQIGLGMRLYADEHEGLYPVSGGEVPWDKVDKVTRKFGWMQQVVSYVKNTNVYHCPRDLYSQYSYFNGARAAYVEASNHFAAVDTKRIVFTSAYVLSGDTLWNTNPPEQGSYPGAVTDADKDDYTYNCVGGPSNGAPCHVWQIHSLGQNILFSDGHAQWYRGYVPGEMTFRYDSMHRWQ